VLATLVASLALCVPASGAAQQLITVDAPRAKSTTATVRLWRREQDCWVRAAGPWPARVGWNGLSASRREGDGTTPLGTFGIGPVIYGVGRNPGVRYRYRQLVCGDWWNEDVTSPTYNRFVHVKCGTRPPFTTKSEGMWQQPHAYRHLLVIEYNTHPIVRGRGSGIFLHVMGRGPTNGCVSIALPRLVQTLRWLRPDAQPRITIRLT
jgi:L,D-peptidoglycan transpeptidase YkuD (ErfK/YbiS/YcfS/YnhG family)